MAQASSIEWTDATWNPVTGCTKISQGCKYCYAQRMAKRLHAMGNVRYRNNFDVTLHEDLIGVPLAWRNPRRIFVNSMSDLFHESVPDSFIRRVFETMGQASWHTFQVLTKRSDRLADVALRLPWPENVWMGVSVENKDATYRIAHLATVPAAVRFLSVEPLIGPIRRLPLRDIDWVIVGGESGPKARPCDLQWIREIRDRCEAARVPFFFKQWGGKRKTTTGRVLDGRTWDELPVPRQRRRNAA
ncbi:MAG TPA: phage Gp37/Gp68 family protein [Gammaproteobacteria bacterium]|nr:phage Gp37/Gp68 family protein [Gammaproteobacteria bacterium]